MIIQAGACAVNIDENRLIREIGFTAERAETAHRGDSNASTARSPRHVMNQRHLVRQFVTDLALHNADSRRGDIGSRRITEIGEAMADGLGLHNVDGRINGMEVRGDSGWAGQNVAVDQMVVRPAEQERAFVEFIPTRGIDASAERVRIRTAIDEGSADVHRPGMPELPTAGYKKSEADTLVHSIVTTTTIDWQEALYGGASGLDSVQENATSANRVMLRTFEEVLVNGVPGLDFQGLRQLKAATAISTVDYSASPSLSAIYADLMALLLSIPEANDDRGAPGNALFLATNWFRKIMPANNFAAGGSMSGADFMAMAIGAEQQFRSVFTSVGIDRVIMAPSLNEFGEAASTTNQAGAMVCQLPQEQGLRKVVGLAPSPVRTATDLGGDHTLWVMRTAGLEAPVSTSIGKLHAKVR